ncbi:hypothetical protein J4G66_04545 [Aeromonas dhakensis]|uniref:hypothetical protein n=1 Tax=Aeromonas dhakensis TaxID=196024 RepID=UPI001BD0303A|nr:hypothetical protein [Aeromonas dhakensis]MBS4715245.1 hypothetical protein [Aeromonas dhakensis]WAF70381.1 hypothetical protein NRK98_10225 [Aeromonas dhakensis]BED99488.1 hypothetical protein VAWG001_11030 [Aeromonas dhakensis]HDZ8878894.1 hypothetical protein [Aeromonas dhakensis]
MKTYIYYPGMEVRDELWLKFALLYLERLAFVFTVSEKSGLTALLQTLEQETDLLAERPDASFFAAITPQIESQIAGLIAPDFVRHKVFGNKELIGRWRTPANHDCFCPAQAGLERLHGFCLAHGFASREEGGFRMARRFANLLSMRLAREWALANEGALITDHDYLDRLLHLLESRYHNRGGQDCFHLEIPLQVPTHLSDIPFAELIALRSRSGFRQQLAEFNQALDALLAMLGSGYAEPAVLTRFEQAQQGLNQLLGPQTQSLPLTTLVSTGLPAMAMIHRLKASHPDSKLVFHSIKKSHFHQRKSQHFFTRLGQVKP